MPPPPPPPPPPPSGGPPPKTQGRAMLLNEIHQGMRLKKTVTNDRSAPIVGGKTSNADNSDDVRSPPPSSSGPSKSNNSGGGIGALFANGVPRKPSEAKSLAARRETPSTNVDSAPTAKPLQPKSITGLPQPHPTKPNGPAPNNGVVQPPSSLPPSTKTKPSLPSLPPAVNKPSTVASGISKPSLPPTPVQKPTVVAKPDPHSISNRPTAMGANKPNIAFHGQLKSSANEPTRLGSSSADQRTTRVEHNEDFPPKAAATSTCKRPAAPPPPPPERNRAPPPSESIPQQRSREPIIRSDAAPLHEAGNVRDAAPPQPPPRVSSYLDSIEQRFHFLPASELPPPPRFIGFQKFYEGVLTQPTR